MVQVKEWIEKVGKGEEIVCKSRFVANRVERLAGEEDVKRLRGLRYLLLLVEWYLALRPGSGKEKGGLRVRKKEELQQLLNGWSNELVESLSGKFSQEGCVHS